MHSLTVNWILCMLQRTFNVTQHVKEDNCQSKNTSHDTRLGYKCTEEQQPHRTDHGSLCCLRQSAHRFLRAANKPSDWLIG